MWETCGLDYSVLSAIWRLGFGLGRLKRTPGTVDLGPPWLPGPCALALALGYAGSLDLSGQRHVCTAVVRLYSNINTTAAAVSRNIVYQVHNIWKILSTVEYSDYLLPGTHHSPAAASQEKERGLPLTPHCCCGWGLALVYFCLVHGALQP